jgi:hypothetical protein
MAHPTAARASAITLVLVVLALVAASVYRHQGSTEQPSPSTTTASTTTLPPSLAAATPAGDALPRLDTPGVVDFTLAAKNQAGAAWLEGTFPTDDLAVTFDLTVVGGTGGDGAALVLAAPDQEPLVGGTGSGLGASWLEAAVVGFDTYQNAGDLYNGFVFVTDFKFQPTLDPVSTSGPVDLRAGTSHVQVQLTDTRLTVTINGVQQLAAPRPDRLPGKVRLGFTAATGGATDQHTISNLAVSISGTPPPG